MYTHTHIHRHIPYSSPESWNGSSSEVDAAKQSVPKNTDSTKKDPENTIDTKPGLTMSAKQAEEFERIYLLGPDARKEAVKGLSDDMYDSYELYILSKKQQARINTGKAADTEEIARIKEKEGVDTRTEGNKNNLDRDGRMRITLKEEIEKVTKLLAGTPAAAQLSTDIADAKNSNNPIYADLRTQAGGDDAVYTTLLTASILATRGDTYTQYLPPESRAEYTKSIANIRKSGISYVVMLDQIPNTIRSMGASETVVNTTKRVSQFSLLDVKYTYADQDSLRSVHADVTQRQYTVKKDGLGEYMNYSYMRDATSIEKNFRPSAAEVARDTIVSENEKIDTDVRTESRNIDKSISEISKISTDLSPDTAKKYTSSIDALGKSDVQDIPAKKGILEYTKGNIGTDIASLEEKIKDIEKNGTGDTTRDMAQTLIYQTDIANLQKMQDAMETAILHAGAAEKLISTKKSLPEIKDADTMGARTEAFEKVARQNMQVFEDLGMTGLGNENIGNIIKAANKGAGVPQDGIANGKGGISIAYASGGETLLGTYPIEKNSRIYLARIMERILTNNGKSPRTEEIHTQIERYIQGQPRPADMQKLVKDILLKGNPDDNMYLKIPGILKNDDNVENILKTGEDLPPQIPTIPEGVNPKNVG